MPPKKRARKADQPVASTSTATETVEGTSDTPRPPLPPDANTGLVFQLPNEIWLEIISYFPSVRIPTLRLSDAPLLPAATLTRELALKALSQTCRAFRTHFLPDLWSRLEVCATRTQTENPKTRRVHNGGSALVEDFYISGAWYKAVANILEKRSNGLRERPDLAQYVTTVSVALTRCRVVVVLDSFVRCLEALPNLHTLQIVRAHTAMTSYFRDAFEGHKIPNVRTAVLPEHAHHVLRACPEVTSVMCNYGDGSKLVGAMQKDCKKVAKMAGFSPDDNMMKRIIKFAPGLEEFRFGSPKDGNVISMLSSCKSLRGIELVGWTPRPNPRHPKEQTDEVIRKAKMDIAAAVKAAKNILENNARGMGEKENLWLRIRSEEGVEDTQIAGKEDV